MSTNNILDYKRGILVIYFSYNFPVVGTVWNGWVIINVLQVTHLMKRIITACFHSSIILHYTAAWKCTYWNSKEGPTESWSSYFLVIWVFNNYVGLVFFFLFFLRDLEPQEWIPQLWKLGKTKKKHYTLCYLFWICMGIKFLCLMNFWPI